MSEQPQKRLGPIGLLVKDVRAHPTKAIVWGVYLLIVLLVLSWFDLIKWPGIPFRAFYSGAAP